MKELLKPIDRISKEFMKLADKNYVNKKLKNREGKCLKCGQCCKRCRFLDKETNLCRVYDSRPLMCHKDFPLDKTEQWIWGVKGCGYSFKR
jgi:hypothetical protein